MEQVKASWSINDPIWFVRISVSLPYNLTIVDDVAYFRCRMSYGFLMKWLWYFEYLQARIKVANPHRAVDLSCGRMDPKMLLGEDFVNRRRVTLIKNKRRKIDDLATKPFADDLFHFKSQEINEQINKLKNEVEALVDGQVNFPVIADFKNEVKRWINKK